jgi:hypothetical protein
VFLISVEWSHASEYSSGSCGQRMPPLFYKNREVIVMFSSVLPWIHAEPVESHKCSLYLLITCHINIILQTAFWHTKWSLSAYYTTVTCYACHIPVHLSLLDFNLIMFAEDEIRNSNTRILWSNYVQDWLNSQQFVP